MFWRLPAPPWGLRPSEEYCVSDFCIATPSHATPLTRLLATGLWRWYGFLIPWFTMLQLEFIEKLPSIICNFIASNIDYYKLESWKLSLSDNSSRISTRHTVSPFLIFYLELLCWEINNSKLIQPMRLTYSELHAKERLPRGISVGLSGIKEPTAIFIRHCILVRNR